MRNSRLVSVALSDETSIFMARSVLFMFASNPRTPQMSGASCGSMSSSSMRVPLVTGSMAG